MFIVEVRPDWEIAPGEPNADLWVPAMHRASAVLARDVESTFDDEFSAIVFRQSVRLLAGIIGATRVSADYELRIREIVLEQFLEERASP